MVSAIDNGNFCMQHYTLDLLQGSLQATTSNEAIVHVYLAFSTCQAA